MTEVEEVLAKEPGEGLISVAGVGMEVILEQAERKVRIGIQNTIQKNFPALSFEMYMCSTRV